MNTCRCVYVCTRDKEQEVERLMELQQSQASQADRALQDFKAQVEANTTKMYDEMKTQVPHTHSD